jgi:hypothetical protein
LKIFFVKRSKALDTDLCCDCWILYLGAGPDGSSRWEE